ncbi:MAG TPA: type VI secretion system baseplate subunit TssE [Bryobacteraceae bacterium]|nr:type VI secretion system baseplate subunit TssE [Bryobacteraceae bacterium]
MARPATDATVTLSVLDRLIDEDPRNSKEVPLTRAQSVRMLRDGVRRDLEWLLNTRQVAIPPDEGLREVNRSLYIFGLPDFTGYSLASPADENKLIRQLHSALKFFEPRLSKVRLVPLEPIVAKTRTFRFRIEALLLMDPAPEHISFDTVLQLTTNQYEVQDAG